MALARVARLNPDDPALVRAMRAALTDSDWRDAESAQLLEVLKQRRGTVTARCRDGRGGLVFTVTFPVSRAA